MIWTLLVVVTVYMCASSLAVIIKDHLLHDLIGRNFSSLPAWMEQLKLTARGFVQLTDWNNDGLIQLGDIRITNDQLILAVPEILGISPIFTGLIAAGALAAALSTADGLLLTISNAIVHDFYFQTFKPEASSLRKVMVSKIVLMIVALTVAWITTHRPVDILYWVACAFSLACSTMFPALFLTIHWKGVTKYGLVAAMTSGMFVAVLYIALNQPWVSNVLNLPVDWARLWDVDPISAGVFGVPIGLLFGFFASWGERKLAQSVMR
jgi:cation/acetate symporter